MAGEVVLGVSVLAVSWGPWSFTWPFYIVSLFSQHDSLRVVALLQWLVSKCAVAEILKLRPRTCTPLSSSQLIV